MMKKKKGSDQMEQLDKILSEMEQIVRKAGTALMDREKARTVREKGYADFVTEVDLQVQTMIRTGLSERFPQIPFMGEEQSNETVDLSGPVWVLDPVDGTTNLIHDCKMSAISLGLVQNGTPVAGVIYQPYLDEMFTARQGGGAFLNGRPIRVSRSQSLRECIIALGTSPYHHDLADRTFAAAKQVFLASMDIRRTGSAAMDLCYVAAGRVDGMFELILQPWDFAAGKLLVEEAGGKLTSMENSDISAVAPSSILATNGSIHDELAQLFARLGAE